MIFGGTFVGRRTGGGLYKITETVKTGANFSPSRRVLLFAKNGRRHIQQAWSDPDTGEVTFNNLAPGYYSLLALDESDDDSDDYQSVAISNRPATLDGSRP